jgi:ATP-dependent Zn protease
MATKKSTRPDSLRVVAIHEAGHAVLQTVLGIGCGGVTIVPDNAKGKATPKMAVDMGSRPRTARSMS